jgi:sortase A
LIGIVCLALYGFFTVRAHFHQKELERQLDEVASSAPPPATREAPDRRIKPERKLKEGDLYGRLEIPRLNMTVMVMEGYKDKVLRLGAGRVTRTPLSIAAHRDTFFRPLKDIKKDDRIRITTPDETVEYRVVSTKIVGPNDTSVLKNKSEDLLVLITCYPFYYVGPAPKRFIVEATKD